jgi:hypothetical protein
MLAGETKTSIELIDTEGKRKPIQREEIDELGRWNQVADARRLREDRPRRTN